MTAAPAFSEETTDEIEVGEPVATKPRSTRKHTRKANPRTKRDPEEVDTCDLTALAFKAARYRQASAMALDGRRDRHVVRALVRAGCGEAEALEIAGRVFATYAVRWGR